MTFEPRKRWQAAIHRTQSLYTNILSITRNTSHESSFFLHNWWATLAAMRLRFALASCRRLRGSTAGYGWFPWVPLHRFAVRSTPRLGSCRRYAAQCDERRRHEPLSSVARPAFLVLCDERSSSKKKKHECFFSKRALSYGQDNHNATITEIPLYGRYQ